MIGAMLASTAQPGQVHELVNSDEWFAQQKIDGHRGLLTIVNGKITMVARSGRHLDHVSSDVFETFEPLAAMGTSWVFDGEYLDGCYYVFDLIEAGGMPSDASTETRLLILERFWDLWSPRSGAVVLIPTAKDSGSKARLVESVKDLGGEGVMFRHRDATYLPGKRSSLLLKVKFRNEVDCVVVQVGVDGKANLKLGLFDGVAFVEVGECTALAGDGPDCEQGDVVTVLCHGASSSGRLVQPTLPKIRTDKNPFDCLVSQLDDARINKEVITSL